MAIFWLILGISLFFIGIKNLSKLTPNISSIKTKGDNFKNLSWVFLLGLFLTALTQSSSAIGVIILVFLDKGKLSFKQAAFFLAGGNVGTTVSGQIFSLSTERLIIPCIIIASACMILGKFFKIKSLESVAKYLVSIIIIFLGLEIISAITLHYREIFRLLFQKYNSIYLAFITGVILTAVSQSSSLIIGILIVMASKNIVTLEYAVASVLGLNVGTSATLLLASSGLHRGGKQGAVFQVVYNGLCALIAFTFMPQYVDLLYKYSHSSAQFVANAHTFFNIGGIIVLIFGWKIIELLVQKIANCE